MAAIRRREAVFMTDKTVILTTASSYEEAQRIARELVERKLAACVNIIPQVSSIYRWQEKVEEARECLMIVKTLESAFDRVREAIGELHSYHLPECISLKIENGSADYLKWIDESVKKLEPPRSRRKTAKGAKINHSM
jgi:periplasmic divalent cation tolerance protein